MQANYSQHFCATPLSVSLNRLIQSQTATDEQINLTSLSRLSPLLSVRVFACRPPLEHIILSFHSLKKVQTMLLAVCRGEIQASNRAGGNFPQVSKAILMLKNHLLQMPCSSSSPRSHLYHRWSFDDCWDELHSVFKEKIIVLVL